MNYALFEDIGAPLLNPLVRLMPVFDLRCGILTLRQKVELMIGEAPTVLFTRSSLASLTGARCQNQAVNQMPENTMCVINGRWLTSQSDLDLVAGFEPGTLLKYKGLVLAACIDESHGEQFVLSAEGWQFFPDETWEIIEMEGKTRMIDYAWDLVRYNGSQIETDLQLLNQQHGQTEFPGVHVLNRAGLFVASGAHVMPGVVIDASNGPVYIAGGAKVMPNTFLEGPLSIGEQSVIKAGARIYGNTTIGPVCKVGGEVEGSVFHSFSNKQHEGFLGHSVIGRWVNLGADTNNSDLKNNYGMVRSFANGEPVDTGLQFVGLTMADHSKTGINSMFNTGTVAGILCNLFGAGFPPANIPDFSWGGADGFEVYRADKGIEVARKVMARRGVTMLAEEEQLILRLYNELVG